MRPVGPVNPGKGPEGPSKKIKKSDSKKSPKAKPASQIEKKRKSSLTKRMHRQIGASQDIAPRGAAKAQSTSASTPTTPLTYQEWLSKYVVTYTENGVTYARVLFNGNKESVSEGIAYGMLMAIKNHDQKTFDELLQYAKKHSDGKGLMDWHLDKNGNIIPPAGSATDADDDMAYALIEASKAGWGAPTDGLKGSYADMAKSMISNILKYDMAKTPSGGYSLTPGDNSAGNIHNFYSSYVALKEWAAFAAFCGEGSPEANECVSLIKTTMSILTSMSDENASGLVPDNFDPFPGPGQKPHPYNHYGYDASRVPLRMARFLAYINGKNAPSWLKSQLGGVVKQVVPMLQKMMATFLAHQKSAGGPTTDPTYPNGYPGGLYGGYNLNGTPAQQYAGGPTFDGPVAAALAVMIKYKLYPSGQEAKYQALETKLYNSIKNSFSMDGPDKNGYYNACLALQSLEFINSLGS